MSPKNTMPISSKTTFTGSPLRMMSFIDPLKDLVEHTEVGNNSWFLVGRLEGEGHHFGFLTHQMSMNKGLLRRCSDGNSIIDLDTGWYRVKEDIYPRRKVTLPKKGLEIRTPKTTITGSFEEWSVHLTVPDGEATLTLRPVGGVLLNAGAGSFSFFGKPVFQYALPSLATTGTVVANDGQTYQVSGMTWFDRQWNPLPPLDGTSLAATWKWTWFNLNLDNGDLISLWDILHRTKEQSFATVLHPNGSQTIVPVTPVAQDAADFWVSPATGNRYPTHWIIRIPTLNAELEVSPQARRDQEVSSPLVSRYEAACSIKGTYQGKPTSGHTYVEMVGNWK